MSRIYGFLSLIIIFFMIVFLTNCKIENSNLSPTMQNVIGCAQKGPFINGSSVTVYELLADLSPTGKSFISQIADNKGTFELNNISLSSSFVSLRADGFYFNEISGKQSVSQITLYALSDVSGDNDININIMTHLEKSRVEYLMKQGKSFKDSKVQAQKEILAIFNIEKSDIKTSENLNISQSGDDNGILLAVSSILQGYRSEAELTELLSNISNDISTDGILDNDVLGSALINHAILLDTTSIRTNLTNRYRDIGANATIPNFEKYIVNFISKTKFVVTKSLISYPETGLNGDNILALSKTTYSSAGYCSFAAQLDKGATLKIKITSLSSDTSKTSKSYWYYVLGSSINWVISDFNQTTYSQTFTSINASQSCDLKMQFDGGTFLIEYFEMNSLIAIRQKTITVK